MRLHRGHLFLWCVIVGAGNVVIATLGHPLIGSIVAFVSGLLAGLTVTRSQSRPSPPAEDIPSDYAAHHLVAVDLDKNGIVIADGMTPDHRAKLDALAALPAEEIGQRINAAIDRLNLRSAAYMEAREEATPLLPVEAPATPSLPMETARGHHRDAPGTPICASLLNGGVAHSPECPLAGQV